MPPIPSPGLPHRRPRRSERPFLKLPRRLLPRCIIASLLSVGFSQATRAQSDRVVITAQAGYAIIWDGNNGGFSGPEPGAKAPENLALATKGVTPFGSTAFLPGGIHDFINVNDGFYGNSSSWISDFRIPDKNPFIGLNFGKSISISSVAWSRDNGDNSERTPPGPFTDRAVGTYTLQVTSVANPGADTADTGDAGTGWATIGTVQYKDGADSLFFSAYLRHRFNVSKGGNSIPATGLRIKVSDAGIDIDEIEVNPPADPTPPISSFIVITNAPGFSINWNGNDGKFYDTNSPARTPANRASASAGTKAFGSSEFGVGIHLINNVNDGLYGNNHSWISKFSAPADANPFIGLNFGEKIEIKNIGWSRDNGDNADCCGGQLSDRALGVYTLQVTRAANPGKDTAETGDSATGWATLGAIHYKSAGTPFRPHLRHLYNVAQGDSPILATGLRIKVSDPGIAIDEIEVNVNAGLQALSDGLVTIGSESGYSITWDGNDGDFFSPNPGASAPANAALATGGAKAFGSGQLFADGSIHDIDNVIDGLYGNSKSWIPGAQQVDPSVAPGGEAFIGVDFGKAIPITTIAWGRDNGNNPGDCCGGQLRDRWQGIYTLQVTTAANPGAGTAETGDAATGWATIGAVEYSGQAAPDFNPWLRHRYSVAKGGNPIQATGLRIKVSSEATCIDEIEVNPSGVPRPAMVIQKAAGYSISWNGNNGKFYDTNSPARAPQSPALASQGASAFGSSEFGAGVHRIAHINDGFYGNSHSWIAKFNPPADTNPFIGLNFGKTIQLRSIAWSRDNGDNAGDCCGGQLADRALGIYTLQVTTVANPGVATAETDNPASGWVTIGSIEYTGEKDARFTPYLRHKFEVNAGGNPIPATGLRIKVSDPNLAIDEIDVNVSLADEGDVLEIKRQPGYSITWDGNDGDFYSEAEGAAAPDNLALASKGVTAFGTTEYDGGGIHLIANVNDGLYGNSKSWIADFRIPDPKPSIGLNFGKALSIGGIAWGRDNGNNPGDCCGGQLRDRWGGIYTLQVTTAMNPGVDTPETGNPATGWATVGTVEYKAASPPEFEPWLRHRFDVSANGNPIQATGVRFKTSDVGICIDEIEVFAGAPVRPTLAVQRQGSNLVITWNGSGALQSADAVTGPWADVAGATASPGTVSIGVGGLKFYRVRQ